MATNPPHRRLSPMTWSFLGDVGLQNFQMARALMIELGERNMFDEGTNVITAELAAGIVPEEFADGPVFHPTMTADAAPSESGEKAA